MDKDNVHHKRRLCKIMQILFFLCLNYIFVTELWYKAVSPSGLSVIAPESKQWSFNYVYHLHRDKLRANMYEYLCTL
jgi:hypothetical protein